MEEKKGEDIVLLDLKEISAFTDYFIICSGSSDRMLRSLAHTVLEIAKNDYNTVIRIEGEPSNGWMVIDLGDIVVHLFSQEQRDFYELEQLWKNGKIILRVK